MLDNHGFDLWANGYDKSVDITDEKDLYPFAGYKNLMNAVYNAIMVKCPAKILDIGIGTGTLALKLYESGNVIIGVDFSSEMLNQSRAKMPNATLIQYDFSKGLPCELSGEKFDFIISTYALHHLTDIEKIEFIQTLLTHLNSAGTIIIGDVGFQNRESLDKCKISCGNEWDDEEFYFVYSELWGKLLSHCTMMYHQISHCAGILEISHSPTE
ncbi:MAG: class I SAM-dependent methyltransferase [Defluviitaleaceae bacterium]|nr:class I SAM-dependent methyltransferase [Defluviitaleaceae bacterium]